MYATSLQLHAFQKYELTNTNYTNLSIQREVNCLTILITTNLIYVCIVLTVGKLHLDNKSINPNSPTYIVAKTV